MGRPIKTNIQYLREYRSVLREIAAGTSYRTLDSMDWTSYICRQK